MQVFEARQHLLGLPYVGAARPAGIIELVNDGLTFRGMTYNGADRGSSCTGEPIRDLDETAHASMTRGRQ